MDKETFLIVGLGNIGRQYEHTRHNVGFDVTDLLAARWGLSLTKPLCRGMVAEAALSPEKRVVLCQPQTLMNLSGECVAPLMNWYKCAPDHLLVICDDIDLAPGRLRLRRTGSAGTHNGLKNIVLNLGRMDFPRLRVGVGQPEEDWDLIAWVLGKYRSREERELMAGAFGQAADCAEDWLNSGIDHAMSYFNGSRQQA